MNLILIIKLKNRESHDNVPMRTYFLVEYEVKDGLIETKIFYFLTKE